LILAPSAFSSAPDSPVPALPSRIGAYTGWVVDLDGNRIADGLDARVLMGPASSTVYLHLHYAIRPTEGQGTQLLQDFPARRAYVFHNYDKIKVETTLGEVGTFADAPGVVAISEFVPPVLTNNVGAPALRVRANATLDDGLDHADAVHALGYFGQGMVVAVLDTGVDKEHPYLNDMDGFDGTDDPKQVLGVNVEDGFLVKCIDPVDDNGHGTHVAGTAVGTGGGAGENVTEAGRNMGAAPGAKYVDVDIGVNLVATAIGLGEDLAFDWVIDYNNGVAACAQGIDHVTNHVDVATMSFGAGGDTPSGSQNTGITELVRSGVVFTNSAGNSGPSANTLTGGAEGAIIVAASNDKNTVGRSDDAIVNFSSRGPRESDGDADTLDELRPDIAGPGVNIVSANTFYSKEPLAGETASLSGTSMSTPFIAGIAALILQANASLTPVDLGSNNAMGNVSAVPVRDILQLSATYKTATMGAAPQSSAIGKFGLPWNNAWGYGLVDAHCAVQMALGNSCSDHPLTVDARGPYGADIGGTGDIEASVSGGVSPYTWQWTIQSSPAGASASFGDATARATNFTADTAGTYVVRATATDDNGTTAWDEATVTVAAPVPPTVFAGSILVGNPASADAGVVQTAAACNPASPLNGLDGVWYNIAGAGSSFSLTMDATLDVDVYFHTASCARVGGSIGAQGFLGATEAGTVPSGAAFAIVNGFAGTGTFVLTLT
jgi:subtilisin family serine protease